MSWTKENQEITQRFPRISKARHTEIKIRLLHPKEILRAGIIANVWPRRLGCTPLKIKFKKFLFHILGNPGF